MYKAQNKRNLATFALKFMLKTQIRVYYIVGLLLLQAFFSACSVTRFVPEDKYLLQKDPAIEGNKALTSNEVYSAINTHTNRRMLMGPKTFLYIYNLGKNIEADSSFLKKILLRRESVKEYYYPLLIKTLVEDIGEAPVLLDSAKLKKDSANIQNLYFAHGYFHPKVSYEVTYIDKFFSYQKSKVKFKIEENTAYIIGDWEAKIADSTVNHIFNLYNKDCKLVVGDNYNHGKMDEERNRIAELMRNNGYFKFSPNFITFDIDTLNVKKPSFRKDNAAEKYVKINININEKPIQYHIGEVKDSIVSAYATIEDLFADFRADQLTKVKRKDLELPDNQLRDTTIHLRYRVSRDLMQELNFDFIGKRIHLKEGELYARSQAVKTQRSLQSLTMFQYVTMSYIPNDSLRKIDVKITNKLSPRMQLKLGAESFTNVVNDNSTFGSNLNISTGINASLRDRNSFSHSEQTELSSTFLVGVYRSSLPADSINPPLKLLYEVRLKASIDFPRFIIPIRKYNRMDFSMNDPKTNITASLRVENRQEYRRITIGSNFSYRWYHIPFSTIEASQLTPLALDVISVPEQFMSSAFNEQLNQLPLLKRDFVPRFSSRFLYNYTWSNYMTTRARPTFFGRASFEEGGTIPFLIDLLTQNAKIDSSFKDHTLFNRSLSIDYGRFLKASVEGKVYIPLWKNGEMVFRGFLGGSYKLKYTNVLPLQNRFYAGGTNGMRGWRSNTLGPGTSEPTSGTTLPPGGDYMMEFNAEFRFKAWSYLNLAFFTDVGNVWFDNKQYVRENESLGGSAGTLTKANLMPAWDGGLGARMDFSFLILRVDIAQKFFLPYRNSFIWNTDPATFIGSFNTNIGIGYPF